MRLPPIDSQDQQDRRVLGYWLVAGVLVVCGVVVLALVLLGRPRGARAGSPSTVPVSPSAAPETSLVEAEPAPAGAFTVSATAVCSGHGMVAWRATGHGTVTVTSGGSSRSGDGSVYLMVTTGGSPITATASAQSEVRLTGTALGECRDPG